MRLPVFFLTFILIGCTSLSDADFFKMSHLSANEFVKTQWQYNIFKTGNDNVHAYHASFNDEQVRQPSDSLVKLCQAGGGVSEKTPLSENPSVNTDVMRSMADLTAFSREIGFYETYRQSLQAFKQEFMKNNLYRNALINYRAKGYFSDSIACKKDGRYIWKMSIIPGAPFEDSSGVSTIPIYLINIS